MSTLVGTVVNRRSGSEKAKISWGHDRDENYSYIVTKVVKLQFCSEINSKICLVTYFRTTRTSRGMHTQTGDTHILTAIFKKLTRTSEGNYKRKDLCRTTCEAADYLTFPRTLSNGCVSEPDTAKYRIFFFPQFESAIRIYTINKISTVLTIT
jgi:hypothetical protein